MYQNPACNTQELNLLLGDVLPPERSAEVVAHLDTCTSCQEELERIAADRHWWDELRHLQTRSTASCVTIAVPRLRASAEAEPGMEDSFTLDFLDDPEEPGQLGRFGSFIVTDLLGRGGMGIVLKAFDSGLHRPVAIKVLAPYFATSAAARKRFDREAKAAAAVVHRHVVPIYSVDVWKGLPYLVMSCVHGHSLQEWLNARGPLPVAEVLRIGMQAARGLAAAHAQGLVHRDVKPANILLEKSGHNVLLSDFGLARAADDASLTQSGVIAGTPPYMAPEQARGAAIDHRADLFSLGSTLYTMCTGQPPFRAESAMAVLLQVCEEPAPALSSANAAVPSWLADIIERLHAKNPADRYQTAAEVADLFERCLAHVQDPKSAKLPDELSKPRNNSPAMRSLQRAIIALVAVAGLAVGAVKYADWGPDDKQKVVRQAPPQKVTSSDSLSLDLDLDLEALFKNVQALQAGLRRPAASSEGDRAAALIDNLWQRLHSLEHDLNTSALGNTESKVYQTRKGGQK